MRCPLPLYPLRVAVAVAVAEADAFFGWWCWNEDDFRELNEGLAQCEFSSRVNTI